MMNDRSKGFAYIAVVYVVALLAGSFIYRNCISLGYLIAIAAADFGATVIIWASGVMIRNSSVYDPYWSVAPLVVLILFSYDRGSVSSAGMIMLVAVTLWSFRLTANWAYTFQSIKYQDWRYDKYRNDFPKLWPLVNFFGINFMPTVIVYFAMVPGLILVNGDHAAGPVTYLAFLICLAAVMIQFVSDSKLHRFRKVSSNSEVCCEGLWRYSRHPNYFGEILMWWGVFLMLLSVDRSMWVTGAGALMNTLLFVFISIPLMEKRQLLNKKGYDEYMLRTNKLIPLSRELFTRGINEH